MKGEPLLTELVLIGLLLSVGCMIGLAYSSISIEHPMGNMICSEKGQGDYISFDRTTKTVSCEPPKEVIQYDGGYIEITRGDER